MKNTAKTGQLDVTGWVEKFHEIIDEVAAPIERANAERLQCRAGCADCCVDDLTIFTVEAAVIRKHHAELLDTAEPHPPGACAFLDGDRNCRIYAHRPYVCRTQGLPLRWLEEAEGEVFESRDICPLNMETGVPLDEIDAEACWTIGPFEARLSDWQAKEDGGRGDRVALRSLFVRGHRHLPIVRS